ncbi:MAG TPA: HAMP domain-containing sensor histidine kinase [Thermomicrobiaceae bacterium]|nr:HAMP domain-containing sensor histidine kinase [Thermomicrobiaceae bacterium]
MLFLLSGAALLGVTDGLAHAIPVVRSNEALSQLGSSPAGPTGTAVTAGTTQAGPTTSAPLSPAASTLTPAQRQLEVDQLQNLATQLHDADVKQFLFASGIALAVMSVASLLLGWIVAGRVLHPLRTITTTTRAISATNLNQRLALGGPDDEVKELGDTIDGLLARLEAAFNAQRRFVANASHELRTPLTMLRTSLDVAVGKPTAPPEVTVLAAKLREGLDQADRLVEELLVLARARHRGLTNLTAVSLDDLVDAALAARRAAVAGMTLTVRPALEPVSVVGSRPLLARLVANLLDNAVRHNVAGGCIRVTTGARGRVATLVVENGGPRLDASRVKLLGEPFQRLGTERTNTDGGIGLGLSIVAAIVEAHHGSLTISARPEGGLRVAVELPLAGTTPDEGEVA